MAAKQRTAKPKKAGKSATPRKAVPRTNANAKSIVLDIVRRIYDMDWPDERILAFEPNSVDRDPAQLYETLQDVFGVDGDPDDDYFAGLGGEIRKTIAFIEARWNGTIDKKALARLPPAAKPGAKPKLSNELSRVFQILPVPFSFGEPVAEVENASALNEHADCLRRGERLGYSGPISIRIKSGVLAPFLGNSSCYVIVSAALRDLILSQAGAEIEIIPLVLRDNSVVSTDYSLINVLGTFDCAATRWTKVKPDGNVEVLFDPAKLDGAPQIFRIPQAPNHVFLRRELFKAIEAAKLKSGIIILTMKELAR